MNEKTNDEEENNNMKINFGSLSAFDEIYTQNYWGKGSGDGSSLEATLPYKNFLEKFIVTNKIKTT